MKLLIIEDDQSVAELERDDLTINGGFDCDLCGDGVQGLQAALEGDYEVYPGHGESTTLNAERESNPYIQMALEQ